MGDFEYNNVTEFGDNLEWEINDGQKPGQKDAWNVRTATKTGAHFTLALPIAASCHEYEHYVPMHGDGCGPACQQYDSGAKMSQYVQELFNVLPDKDNIDLFTSKEGG